MLNVEIVEKGNLDRTARKNDARLLNVQKPTRNPVSQTKHGGIANNYMWGKGFSSGVIQPHWCENLTAQS